MNQQPIEKLDYGSGYMLDVHSIFHTIQGEGPYCGAPCVFVRLAGCNLQCPLCDTDYTSNAESWEVTNIIERVAELTPPWTLRQLVVITGGEPFRQNIELLCRRLTQAGFVVQIETNGTLPIPPTMLPMVRYTPELWRTAVYVVCSPKTGKVHGSFMSHAVAFKYVGRAGDLMVDGLPSHALAHSAHPHLQRPPADALVYLQPADEKDATLNADNTDACVQSCLKHGHILQLQLHKIINVE